MPDDPVRFPVQKPTKGLIPLAGRQSAILAKTLFTNRFSSPILMGRTRGIRLGGRGFQMIKKGLRKSTGFDVFTLPARPPCATHNPHCKAPDTGRRLGRLKGGSVARWPAAQGLRGFVVGDMSRQASARARYPAKWRGAESRCRTYLTDQLNDRRMQNPNNLAKLTLAALSKRGELTKLVRDAALGIGRAASQAIMMLASCQACGRTTLNTYSGSRGKPQKGPARGVRSGGVFGVGRRLRI
jgi:hypothetical protein